MHTEDTPTITTQASRYEYSMAIVRAIAEHLVAIEHGAPLATVPVYVPHWLEAGEPWSLSREADEPEWTVSRPGGQHPTTGRPFTGCSLRFGDNVATAAQTMLAWDQGHPFLVAATSEVQR